MKAVLALLLGVAYGMESWNSLSSWDHEFTTAAFNEQDSKQLFSDWMRDNARTYSTLEEEAYRYKLWFTAMQKIIESNDQGLTYKLRMNQFGDLTDEEFKLQIHGHTGSCLNVPKLETLITPTDNIMDGFEASTSIDWQASGDVTLLKIKDNVDHVGHLVQQVQLNVNMQFKKEH
eukprot:136264_1